MSIKASISLYSVLVAKFLSITEARKHFLELPDELEDDSIVITRHGKPVMAAMSYQQFESLLETVEILSDSKFSGKLRESIAQADNGESSHLDEVEARLSQ